MEHESYVARQKLSPYLVFKLVVRRHSNACYISTTKYDSSKYDIKIMFSIIFWNIARTVLFSTYTLKVYYKKKLEKICLRGLSLPNSLKGFQVDNQLA